jgi:hypothetical protein
MTHRNKSGCTHFYIITYMLSKVDYSRLDGERRWDTVGVYAILHSCPESVVIDPCSRSLATLVPIGLRSLQSSINNLSLPLQRTSMAGMTWTW